MSQCNAELPYRATDASGKVEEGTMYCIEERDHFGPHSYVVTEYVRAALVEIVMKPQEVT